MDISILSLYTRYHHTLDEEFLREKEKQDWRNEHQHGSRHQQVALFRKDRVESLQAEGHCPIAFTLQIDQGRVEIIPGIQHAEDGHCGDDRIGLRQDHMP